MAIRKIIRYGDPILRKKSREVKDISPRLKEQIEDMIETLHDSGRGIGLAAPQVGLLKRIFVIDLQEGEGTKVFINPEIIKTEGEQCTGEACLSVPGRQGTVKRPAKLTVRAMDIDGQTFEEDAEGVYAVCISHENDHLDGILFIDKMETEIFEEDEASEE